MEEIAERDLFQAEICAQRLKVLGDPHRIRIVEVLRQGEFTVSDISAILDVEIVNISHHLKMLRRAELVEVRREGRYKYYSLASSIFTDRDTRHQFLDLGCCRIEVPHA